MKSEINFKESNKIVSEVLVLRYTWSEQSIADVTLLY